MGIGAIYRKRAREDSNSPILKETSKIGRLESIDLNLGQVWDKKTDTQCIYESCINTELYEILSTKFFQKNYCNYSIIGVPFNYK